MSGVTNVPLRGIADTTKRVSAPPAHIDHGHLVVTSHRSVDPSNFGNCNDAVYSTEPVEVGDDLTLSYIEDHELIGVHVRYVKPAMFHIEALIVEADGGSRHGNTRDCREHLITRRCL